MPLQDVEYLSLSRAAVILGLRDRRVRDLCEEYDWFGGKLGDDPGAPWVITREEVNKMRITPRRGPGRPPGSRKPIGEPVSV
jgi:hypothetical protein